MSGPKYSAAQLKQMEEERLERERQEKLRKLREELEAEKRKLKVELAKVDEIEKKTLNLQNEINERLRRFNREDTLKLSTEVKFFLDKVKSYSRSTLGDKEQVIKRTNETKIVIKQLDGQLEELKKKSRDNMNIIHGDEIEQAEREEERENLNIIIHQPVNLSEYDEIIDKYSVVYDISETDKKEIAVLRENVSRLRDDVKSGEEGKLNELKNEALTLEDKVERAKKHYTMYLAAYDEYLLRAQIYGEEPVEIEYFKDVIEIDEEIEEINKAIQEKDRLEYISSSIDDVMREFGHQIVGSNVFKSGSEVHRKKYYTFHEHGVLTVTQNENGSIVIETGVMGDDMPITCDEKEIAVRNMHHLCEQYPEMAKRLDEKGIVVNQSMNMPVDEKYATKVSEADAHSNHVDETMSSRSMREKRLANIEKNRARRASSKAAQHLAE